MTRAVAVLALMVAAALAGCGSSDGASSGSAADPAGTQPTTGTTAAEPTNTPPQQYAVIVPINSFGDLCAGADFRGTANELAQELHLFRLPARIRTRNTYPSIDSGQWCVQVGPDSSEADANSLAAKVRAKPGLDGGDNLKANVVPIGPATR